MARREEEYKLVIYIATPIRWLFFGLYDPLLWWAMKRVTNTIRVLVPDVDITRYREAGALVLVTDRDRAEQVREAVANVHAWIVSSIQKIWLLHGTLVVLLANSYSHHRRPVRHRPVAQRAEAKALA